ncbi:Hint domain-containing protein, partial [Roseomonas sp. CECT 9278]|uniref:Hint domain-containing protein n=1 Tax=Roseomonas sp. CECT 9278 TaxID=2845823 RepID=UPI001E31145F
MLTPAGEVPVEALRPGALVLAVGGGAPFQPLVEARRVTLPGPCVRVLAGAMADGAPQDDLRLPPDHALLVDGLLVAARDLVDGHGILAEADGAVDVVQIVLAAHDAVLAAGLAVETARAEPGLPDCAPRGAPPPALRAMLAWRAEAMGWCPATPPPAPP